MQVPLALVNSLNGIKDFDEQLFIDVHLGEDTITSIRCHPKKKESLSELPFQNKISGKIPWTRQGYYLKDRPSFTFDPLFHGGAYYVQEASSMFLEQALQQTADLSQSLKVLDLCAAPGGKSTHIQSLISKDSLLVSNETIRSRVPVLKENLQKWGSHNVFVTNNDPSDFAKLTHYFDVVVVDAPCSGSGLLRKDPKAVEQWSQGAVNLCSQRQQRIVADVIPALKEGGVLIYATCSYSPQENEAVADWITTDFEMDSIPLQTDASWNITSVATPKGTRCYRFWPYQLQGEGFFIAVFRKKEKAQPAHPARGKHKLTAQPNRQVLQKWISQPENFVFKEFGNTVFAWPEPLLVDFEFLAKHLNGIYSGIAVGQLIREKLIPDHALALSCHLAPEIPRVALNKEQAISYLQRKELNIDSSIKGWQLATYNNLPLGWMNVLPHRVNNYYPKELRILKDK